MKKRLLSNWNFIRALRALMGIAILVQAVLSKDVLLGIMGLLFTSLAVLNRGCCSNGVCNVTTKQDKNDSSKISYEEVV